MTALKSSGGGERVQESTPLPDAAPSTGVSTTDACDLLRELDDHDCHRLLGWLCGRDPELVVDTINRMRAFKLNQAVAS